MMNCSMCKNALTFLFVLVLKLVVQGQSKIDFMNRYNSHIDPFGKLDSIKVLKLRIISEIKQTINSHYVEMNSEQVCEYFKGKSRRCTYTNGRKGDNWDMFPIPEQFDGNEIKYQLNYIPTEEPNLYFLKSMNDSIVVIQKKANDITKQTLTFDSKTLNLLQQLTEAERSNYISYTNFISYQTVDGILIPKEIRLEIKFKDNFATATVRYEEVEFVHR